MICLINVPSVDKEYGASFETSLVVKSNGSIIYVTPGVFVTSCKVNLLFYPFDYQKCDLKFASWTLDAAKV